MKQTVENIRKKFLNVKHIIGDDFSINHLDDSTFITTLCTAVERTYIALNEGMCEEINICHTCAEHRDKLKEVMVMLEDIEAGATLTDAVGDHFMAFSLELDQVIKRIDTVLAKI